MANTETTVRCVACDRTQEQVPLLTLGYKHQRFAICPQHLPILIHDPKALAGRMPGAETMEPAEHRD